MSMDGMTVEDKCERLEPCGVMNESSNATTDSVQVCSNLHFCACPRASRHSRNCPQWSHRC